MNMYDITDGIHNVLDSIVYLSCSPPIRDFTVPYRGKFVLSSKKGAFAVDFQDLNLRNFSALLFNNIFSERLVVTWDVKRLISYLRYRNLTKDKYPQAKVIDLKYACSFLGRHITQPDSFKAAMEHVKFLKLNKDWASVSQKIHMPLAFRVIPDIETKGVLSVEASRIDFKKLYCWYDIEGQVNGRMLSYAPSERYLTVHTLSQEVKERLQPRMAGDNYFLIFDYKHMEVSVLQFISQDKNLKSLLEMPGDFYLNLYKFLFNEEGSREKRDIGKQIFLPVVFGMQAETLSKRFKLSLETAKDLIGVINSRFCVAIEWLQEKQDQLADDPIAVDCFGRKRDFTNEKLYKRRNFEVQSPAALICLQKLCDLHKHFSQRIIFHIHDGYVLCVPKQGLLSFITSVRKILNEPAEICPGLELRVGCKLGHSLGVLRTLF